MILFNVHIRVVRTEEKRLALIIEFWTRDERLRKIELDLGEAS